MNEATVAALKRLNQEFYEDYSKNFSSTRILPWQGWRRVLDLCLQAWCAKATENPTSILDVGCGNGRFGQLLDQEFADPFDYFGLDYSADLLAVATEKLRPGRRGDRTFLKMDLTSSELGLIDFGRRFQLIAACGILHHIPGHHSRQELLRTLTGHLEAGGLLVLSFWQFGSKNRFLDRTIPWTVHNQVAAERVDLEELETGDYILPWGNQKALDFRTESLSPRRYCHYSSPQESARLVGELPLDVVETFFADGKTGDLNLYYILTQSG